MTDTLTALDATFLELEEQSEGALMHTGGVMVFDPLPAGGAPTVEDLCALVTGTLAGLPRCSLNLAIGSRRRYAAVCVPLADLTAIRSELGGSIDDAILTACTSGLRSLLLERDEDCESMPDLGVLAYGIEEGIEELLELAGASRLKPADATAKHLTHT
jgi:Wax ester synthase-like Acyl-CoA acyltransferase domain